MVRFYSRLFTINRKNNLVAVKVSKIDITTIYIHLCEMSWKYFEIHLAVPWHGLPARLDRTNLYLVTYWVLEFFPRVKNLPPVERRQTSSRVATDWIYCKIEFTAPLASIRRYVGELSSFACFFRASRVPPIARIQYDIHNFYSFRKSIISCDSWQLLFRTVFGRLKFYTTAHILNVPNEWPFDSFRLFLPLSFTNGKGT